MQLKKEKKKNNTIKKYLAIDDNHNNIITNYPITITQQINRNTEQINNQQIHGKINKYQKLHAQQET